MGESLRRYLLTFLYEVRNSYWFVPAVMTAGAFMLGFLMPVLDAWAGDGWVGAIPFLTLLSVDGARAMLTTIAGSIIGVAGVTFSIAIAAVSFASGNYGPRLIGNFMRDRGNQFTLGTFVAAFVYCVVVLRAIHAGTDAAAGESAAAFVPQGSIMLAMALMLLSIAVLIFFIHHVPESINIMNIAARIGRDLKTSVHTLFPDVKDEAARTDEPEREDAPDDEREPTDADDPVMRERGYHAEDALAVRADSAGYLQQFDLDHLDSVAEGDRLVVRVLVRPGSFVTTQDPVMLAWRERGAEGVELGDDQRDALLGCFTIGSERTNFQDILFLVDELVEIAARALSPGVNDPFTANACFDWLRAGLIEFVRRAPDREFETNGNERVVVFPVSFARVLSAVMDQSRQYLASDRNATLHALSTLAEVGHACRFPEQRETVLEQMDKLCAAARSALGDGATDEVNERLRRARKRASEGQSPAKQAMEPRPVETIHPPGGDPVAA